MATAVVKFPVSWRLICTTCGAAADATCNCGTPYEPATARAAVAIAANPKKSDRAIAAEIGVSDMTVGRARKATATDVAVEKRVGRDGKARKLPNKKKAAPNDDDMPTEEEVEVEHQATLYDQSCLLLDQMTDATRRKYFAHIRRKYNGYDK